MKRDGVSLMRKLEAGFIMDDDDARIYYI